MKRLAIAGAVSLVAVAASLVGAAAYRTTLVEAGIAYWLQGHGMAGARFAVREVALDHLRLGAIRLGPEGAISATDITIGYSPLGLAHGRIGRVEITGLRAQLDARPGSVTLVGLPKSLAGGAGGGGGAAMLPIGELVLRDARIVVLAPTGEAELRADGTYAPGGARLVLALEAPNGEARATATLAVAGQRVTIDAKADIPAESVLWGLTGLPPPSVGDVRIRLAAEGTSPRALPALAAAPELDSIALQAKVALDADALDGLDAGRGLGGVHLEAQGRMTGTGGGLAGTADIVARLRQVRRGDVRVDDVALAAPVAFDVSRAVASVRLTGTGRVEAASLRAGALTHPGPVRWRLAAGDAPLLQAGGKGSSPAISLVLASAKDEMQFAQDRKPLPLVFADSRIALHGALGADATARAEFGTTVARLGEPSLVAPLGITGSASLADGIATITSDARDAKGRTVAHLAGTAAVSGDRADLALTIGPFDFAPGGLQPASLSPALDGFTDVRGRASGAFHLRRTGARTEGSGEVRLDGLSFRLGGIAVRGANSEIRLDNLAPLSTPPGQLLTANEVALVAALADLRVEFRLAPGPVLAVRSVRAAFAGGELTLGPFAVGAGIAPERLTVAARNVKIEPLLQILDVAGLSGTGTLNGTVPLGVADGRVTIHEGRLASEGKGVIQLKSEQAAKALAAGGESARLMVRALEDFHYDTLAIELDKDASGDARATIHITGANPAVMNGQPFVFNVNVTSNVDKLIDALMQGYRLATDMLTRAAKGAAHAR
jgi:Dicarboxylate transport